MSYKDFTVDGIGTITVQKRRGNRSLRLTLAGGKIRVSIPTWTPYSTGLSFALSKKTWILTHHQPAQAELRSGMAIGKTRTLQLVPDYETPSTRTSIRGNEVIVWFNPKLQADDTLVQQAAERASYRALKSESIALITPRLSELANQHGFSYRSLNFKRMKSRWGSCDQRQNIVINIFLVQLPWECIDYVLLHELTHTRALHHGPDFWEAMDTVLPNARGFKRTMRAYQPTLMPKR